MNSFEMELIYPEWKVPSTAINIYFREISKFYKLIYLYIFFFPKKMCVCNVTAAFLDQNGKFRRFSCRIHVSFTALSTVTDLGYGRTELIIFIFCSSTEFGQVTCICLLIYVVIQRG